MVMGLLWGGNAYAFPFTKLQEFLSTNSVEDPSTTIYTFNRCAALSQFFYAISYERNKSLAEKYKKKQFVFLMSAAKLHMDLFNVREDKAIADLTKAQREMATLYMEEGNSSYVKTGSHLNSSINSDHAICDHFGKK